MEKILVYPHTMPAKEKYRRGHFWQEVKRRGQKMKNDTEVYKFQELLELMEFMAVELDQIARW